MSGKPYAIKTELPRIKPRTFTFRRQKTMYGGKLIAAGDVIFIFASENEGGSGLVAAGRVLSVEAVPLKKDVSCAQEIVDAGANDRSGGRAPRSQNASLSE